MVEEKCKVFPMIDAFDDYVRNKGINICCMILMTGVFAHWLYIFSVFIVSDDDDMWYEWWMIIAWVAFAFILPTILVPLITLGNSNPREPKSAIKVIISLLVVILLVVENVYATINQVSISEANDDISDIAYYGFYSYLLIYIFSTIFGVIMIGLYVYILILHKAEDTDVNNVESVSYHAKKTKQLRELNKLDRDANIGENENDNDKNLEENEKEKNENGDEKDKIENELKEIKKDMELEAERGKGNIRSIIDWLWPESKFSTKELIKLIPVPSRVYQILFVGIIGLVGDLEVSMYARYVFTFSLLWIFL